MKADTRKLESTEAFNQGLTDDVRGGRGGPPGGGGPIGLKNFADQRRAFLLNLPDVKETGIFGAGKSLICRKLAHHDSDTVTGNSEIRRSPEQSLQDVQLSAGALALPPANSERVVRASSADKTWFHSWRQP